jgi:hypothetical protein
MIGGDPLRVFLINASGIGPLKAGVFFFMP